MLQEELEGAKGAGVVVVQRESDSGESGEAEDVKMVVEEEVVAEKRAVSEKAVDHEESA